MHIEEQAIGISLLCNPQGKIIEIIRNDLEINVEMLKGQLFTSILDKACLDKTFNFLTELRTKGAAFDWVLTLPINKKLIPLHFVGSMSDNLLFIVGAKTLSDINNYFYDELMKLNNEQANAFRKIMKDHQKLSASTIDRDSQFYDELTQLNNELAATQRELAKKNNQLEQQKQELKVLNQELSATIDELERTRDELVQSEKMASLGRLVSGFAHEINTPIGIAVTAASAINEAGQRLNDMLSQDEVSETELMASIDKMIEGGKLTFSNVRRAAELVSSFKRTSIDQTQETKRLFALHEVIRDIIISLDSKFRRTAITIENQCPTNMNIYGYPGIISQILNNLLMNSLIHGFDDGMQSGQITLHVQRENNTILMEYQDTGKGMDKETAEKLFEPFYTTKRARGGTGLGMYICYNLVTTRLKGTIYCESTPDEGSVFHINFPIENLEQRE
ncbi:periplasmic sensor signal transduction histidine kinase [Beggiatoa sp. PS]|nr:periplasmic sensor signal transduction histidine kinase [Beggiatoa sp. PS]